MQPGGPRSHPAASETLDPPGPAKWVGTVTEALPGSQVGRLPVCYRVEAAGAGQASRAAWAESGSCWRLSRDHARILSPDRAGHSHRHCALAGSSRFWQPSSGVGATANMKHLQRPFVTICAGNREAGCEQPQPFCPRHQDQRRTLMAPSGPGPEHQIGTRTRVAHRQAIQEVQDRHV